jgi:hypothetical protein
MPIDKIPKSAVMDAIIKLGPSQPIDIRKELKMGDSYLIGALLSELVSERKLAISKTRRGGSPFYYDPTEPAKLEALIQWVNEKDKRTYALLKEHGILREDAQDPLVRFGLQHLPDFSFQTVIDGVVYWRHFLLSEEDAMRRVGGVKKASAAPTPSPEPVEKTVAAPAEEPEAPPKKAKKGRKKKDALSQEVSVAADPKTPVMDSKIVERDPKTATDDSAQQEPLKEESPKPAPVKEPKAKKPRAKKGSDPVIMPDGAVMISPQEWLAHDTLYEKVRAFAGDLILRDARVHKPHMELTCIIQFATPFGAIDAFVHAFNKKFTPDDLKESMPRARELGMPIIILSVDPIPSKVSGAFKGQPNILFTTMERK